MSPNSRKTFAIILAGLLGLLPVVMPLADVAMGAASHCMQQMDDSCTEHHSDPCNNHGACTNGHCHIQSVTHGALQLSSDDLLARFNPPFIDQIPVGTDLTDTFRPPRA